MRKILSVGSSTSYREGGNETSPFQVYELVSYLAVKVIEQLTQLPMEGMRESLFGMWIMFL